MYYLTILTKINVFPDLISCSFVDKYLYHGWTCCLKHKGWSRFVLSSLGGQAPAKTLWISTHHVEATLKSRPAMWWRPLSQIWSACGQRDTWYTEWRM